VEPFVQPSSSSNDLAQAPLNETDLELEDGFRIQKDENSMGPEFASQSKAEEQVTATGVASTDSDKEAPAAGLMTQEPPCQGVESHGRCWYLSEPGNDCQSTCLYYGRAFRFGIAPPSVLTELLGFQPLHIGGPWMAFDTYNRKENKTRSHSSCSANDYRDKDGTWSNPNHQIACPCGGVTECYWKQPPACEAVFIFRGMRLSGCVKMAGRGDPWCQHDHDDQEGWSHCIHTCMDGSTGRITQSVQAPSPKFVKVATGPDVTAGTDTTTPGPLDDAACVWTLHKDCHPEFDYGPDHLVGCTRVDHHEPWCSKAKVFNGSWAHCEFSCPEVHTASQARELKVLNHKAEHENKLCTWMMPKKCSSTTLYAGVEYEGCIKADEPGEASWCSHDAEYKGEWTFCQHRCFTALDEGRMYD